MTLYVPRHFRVDDRETLERFIATHAFGTLISTGPDGICVSHVPFLPERSEDGKLRLRGHVARANPHWQALAQAAEVLVIFEGPHAYVSPGWYAQQPSVPTWNYAVVHARGRACLLPAEQLPPLLDRLSRAYEEGRPAPWRMQALPAAFTESMLAAIVGFEIAVEKLEGKFKLSQNRRGEDIERVAAALEAQGQQELAALMRAHADHAPDSR